MNNFQDYALLFAASLPVILIAGIQVFLFVSGERGTLLIPGLQRYPRADIPEAIEEVAVCDAQADHATRVTANEQFLEEAA